MKRNRFTLMIAICIAIVILLPLVRHYVFGFEMRQVPGAVQQTEQPQTDAVSATPTKDESPLSDTATPAPETVIFESDYGYYADDKWVESQCGFYVTAPETGNVALSIYYPFDITGNQVGHVYLDGQHFTDFTIEENTFQLKVPCQADQRHYIQINSDFAKDPGEEDKRTLAFVLLETSFAPDADQSSEEN